MAGVHANINAAPVDVEEKFADAMEARAAAPRRHEVFQEYIARVALPENAEVLGIGCDTGGITRQLAAIPGLGRGTGLDPAPVPLGRARQLASGIDGIRFVDDDCREIEAGDAGYDVARYKNIAAYTAIAVGAEVDPDSGAVRVVRAVAANDSGQIINPDRVRNQVEGGVVQSTSWTVKEAVLFDRTRILSEDWATYPIPRFPEVPEVEVELIDRPGEPYLGTGETAQGPTARAIANAVFGAAGARARDPADAGAGQDGDVLMSAARRPAATAGSARLGTVVDRSAPHPNACRAEDFEAERRAMRWPRRSRVQRGWWFLTSCRTSRPPTRWCACLAELGGRVYGRCSRRRPSGCPGSTPPRPACCIGGWRRAARRGPAAGGTATPPVTCATRRAWPARWPMTAESRATAPLAGLQREPGREYGFSQLLQEE